MLARFRGADGPRLLTEAIRAQRIVCGDSGAAEALARVIEPVEVARGEALIAQGGADNDLYLILSGSMDVKINGRSIATRSANQHVGELALIDPGGRRSATVVALEPTVVGRVSEPAFSAVAELHPRLWRALAVEIGARLKQRSRFITPPNDHPVVFIGSSSEGLPAASLLQAELEGPELEVRLWSSGVFTPSQATMEDLERQLGAADFAILVVTGDDVVTSRGKNSTAPRDNVVFELGLFMGALSRARTFMVVSKDVDVKIPTDLLGLTQLRFSSANLKIDLQAVGATLRSTVMQHGPR